MNFKGGGYLIRPLCLFSESDLYRRPVLCALDRALFEAILITIGYLGRIGFFDRFVVEYLKKEEG